MKVGRNERSELRQFRFGGFRLTTPALCRNSLCSVRRMYLRSIIPEMTLHCLDSVILSKTQHFEMTSRTAMNFLPDNSAEHPLAQKPDVVGAEERLWIALQYVLSELDDTAAEEFESLLERDLLYCESLVEATRIVAALSETCGQFHQRTATHKRGQILGNQLPLQHADRVSTGAEKVTLTLVDRIVPVQTSAFDASAKFRGLTVSIALTACGLMLLLFSGLNGFPVMQFVGHTAVDRGSDGAVVARELLSLYVTDEQVFGVSVGFGADELDAGVDDPEFMVPEWLFAAVELERSQNPDGQSSSNSSVTPDSPLSDEDFESEIF